MRLVSRFLFAPAVVSALIVGGSHASAEPSLAVIAAIFGLEDECSIPLPHERRLALLAVVRSHFPDDESEKLSFRVANGALEAVRVYRRMNKARQAQFCERLHHAAGLVD